MSTYFSEVSDFRVQGRCLHLLSDVLGLILCGVLADCDDYLEIVDYGKDKITFLRTEKCLRKAGLIALLPKKALNQIKSTKVPF